MTKHNIIQAFSKCW